jgi:hypothetical protein
MAFKVATNRLVLPRWRLCHVCGGRFWRPLDLERLPTLRVKTCLDCLLRVSAGLLVAPHVDGLLDADWLASLEPGLTRH